MKYFELKDRKIRIFHGELDKPWAKRGMTHGEYRVNYVEGIIFQLTGMQHIKRRFCGQWVELLLREDKFKLVAVALQLSINPSDHNFWRKE